MRCGLRYHRSGFATGRECGERGEISDLTKGSQLTRRVTAAPGERAASVHHLLAQREADQLGRLVEVELLHDLLAVGLDRVLAEREGGGDLAVRAPLGDELEDLALPPRETREVVVVPRRSLPQVVAEQHAGDLG